MAHILVVDDEASVRRSLRMVLEGEHRVSEAENVDAGLATLRQEPVDLVLLDLSMPGRQGRELLIELEDRPDGPPVVIVTATKRLTTAEIGRASCRERV